VFASSVVPLIVAVLFNAAVVVERGASYRPENWRQAQAFVAGDARARDGIVFAPTSKAVAFEYYQLRTRKPFPRPLLPRGPWGAVNVDFARLTHDRPADLVTNAVVLRRSPRVWLVIASGPGGGPSPSFLQSARETLASTRKSGGSWKFGRVVVQLYEPRG